MVQIYGNKVTMNLLTKYHNVEIMRDYFCSELQSTEMIRNMIEMYLEYQHFFYNGSNLFLFDI